MHRRYAGRETVLEPSGYWRIFGGMVDTPVIFKAVKISEGDWQIACHCPGGKIEYVTGFLDEPSTQNWLATEHRDHWLKVRGYQP
jgi:hypothetical protein